MSVPRSNGSVAPPGVVYLALVGGPDAGKTATILALAEPLRERNPNGYSCTLLNPPPEHLLAPGVESHVYLQSQEWLEQNRQLLRDGKPLAPNAMRKNILRFLFEFTTDKGQHFVVELIDYPGEQFNPELTRDALAQELQNVLQQTHALLVLAEVPRPGQPANKGTETLGLIQTGLAHLRHHQPIGPLFDKPVVVLLNKFDRQTPRECFCHKDPQSAAAAFLTQKPPPPHNALLQAIRSVVPTDYFAVFPTSAFGKTIAAEGKDAEMPASYPPLLSYGLEDPFLWVLTRPGARALATYEEQTLQFQWWKPWQLLARVLTCQGTHAATTLDRYYPKPSPERDRFQAARGRRRMALTAQGVVLAALLLLGTLVGETMWDAWSHKSVQVNFANQTITDEGQLRGSEQWLEDYVCAPWFQHSGYRLAGLSHSQAEKELGDYRTAVLNRYLQEVDKHEPGSVAQIVPAQIILERFPNCPDAPRIEAILDVAKQNQGCAAVDNATDEDTKVALINEQLKRYPNDIHASHYVTVLQGIENQKTVRRETIVLESVGDKLANLKRKDERKPEPFDQLKDEIRKNVNHPDLTKEKENLLTRIVAANNAALQKTEDEEKKNLGQVEITHGEVETSDVKGLERLSQTVAKKNFFQFPLAVTPKVQSALWKLQGDIDKKLGKDRAKVAFGVLREDYNNHIQRGDLLQAAQKLNKPPPIGFESEIDNLKQDFRTELLKRLDDREARFLKDRDFDQALAFFQSLKTDQYVKVIVPANDFQKLNVDKRIHKVKEDHDKHFYENYVEDPRIRCDATITKFLNESWLEASAMKDEVAKLKDYPRNYKDELKVRITVDVLWGNPYRWYWTFFWWVDYKLTVRVSGKSPFVKEGLNCKEHDQKVPKVGIWGFKAKLDEPVKIEVFLNEGTNVLNVTLRELLDGRDVPLRDQNENPWYRTNLHLRVEIPPLQDLTLPKWRK